MATINLSSNGPSISKSYQNVVNAAPKAGGSPTHGQWAVFSVSTPLVNAFQRDSGNKESVLKVQSTGEGELADLVDEFSEGKVQFAFVKVIDPNTGLPKNVLIAWCGEGVPERTKGYFTSHLAAVSKFLHGYHVQITARSDGDLTPEGIIQKVGDASGAKYTSATDQTPAPVALPTAPAKPVFTPARTGGLEPKFVATVPERKLQRTNDDDGWGADAPPVTRSQLEKVQPAYKPTKVNMQELRSERSPAADASARPVEDSSDVVKGGYQPVGKVDIAAIRRQALEAGGPRDDRPEPVRGSYEPVGKVDIAAIRSKAQKPTQSPGVPDEKPVVSTDAPVKSSGVSSIHDHSERLTSLPKPKVAKKFGSSPQFPGTKPPLPSEPSATPTSSTAAIGGASRTFANQGGKTPAQLWAERKAREQESHPGSSSPNPTEPSVQSHESGAAGWKSSYSGKSWAPVQTTEAAKSTGPADFHQANDSASEAPGPQDPTAPNTDTLRGPPTHDTTFEKSTGSPETGRTASFPGVQTGPVQREAEYPAEVRPESPAPPSPPARETSPIRIAIPVGQESSDTHAEQSAPSHAIDAQSTPTLDDSKPDLHEAEQPSAGVFAADHPQESGIKALVQYDYEKAEDNEIELREGEFVTEIEMVDKDWWLGTNSRGEKGLFPSNYVEPVDDNEHYAHPSDADVSKHEATSPAPPAEIPVPAAESPSKEHTAIALYDYEAAEDNELSFPEGAEITNIEFPDKDWWFGEYNQKRGLFPSNYVQ
ncbi:putative actin binding protein [Aspergillus candidus]|uniref:Actin binding protein n=1 Tax=Aspergillus candidus TaxID=41067 RepID=A0A2I2F7W6_ASPCN|nr:hypothetical protein BDW47DRAFT_107974 [Aspergillus candidus]PLB36720.1 hypothetical protein BDW47DRAFT_107974 [Aspergillus candidus]